MEAKMEQLKTLLYPLLLLVVSISVKAQKYDFVVAQDGSGQFKTVQEAINAVPDFRKNRTTIYIKKGTYKEKLVLAESKSSVTFIGEDAASTVLTYDDFALKHNRFGEEIGTTGTASFYVFGNDFQAKNITFQNSAGPVGQAVAIWIKGDRAQFENCKFLGFQDTLYTFGHESRQYYKNCYIEGTVDFIFGSSTAVFDSCQIHCKGKGYITAASTYQWRPFGYVFMNCKITGESESTHFLGRPWRPFSRVAFINSELGDVIKSEGWDNWRNPANEKTAFYAEYKNTGAGSPTENRVNWAKQLTAEQAKEYTTEKIFGDWIPQSI
jgi:pectinesterase